MIPIYFLDVYKCVICLFFFFCFLSLIWPRTGLIVVAADCQLEHLDAVSILIWNFS